MKRGIAKQVPSSRIPIRQVFQAPHTSEYHNGNKFFNGVVIPVAPERYRSFDSLTTELTSILTKSVTLPSGVRNIFSMEGKKVFFFFCFESVLWCFVGVQFG